MPLQPVAVDSGAAGGGTTGGAGSGGAECPLGTGGTGGTGACGPGTSRKEALSSERLREWAVQWSSPSGGASHLRAVGAGTAGAGGAGTAGAGGSATGGTGVASAGGIGTCRQETLSLERLREWAVQWGSPGGGASRAHTTRAGGVRTPGATGGTGGAVAVGAAMGSPGSRRQESLSPELLREWAVQWGSPGGGASRLRAGGAGNTGAGGVGTTGAGGSATVGTGARWQETLSPERLREWPVQWGSPVGIRRPAICGHSRNLLRGHWLFDLVKAELQERHTCTDLGELRSYLGLQITRDRARRTITLTHSHMVQQVLQRFDFQFSSPQPTPLSTGHSLSAPPSDESVELSGPYPELVGCLIYLMTCTGPDLAYPLSLLARYMAPGRHRKGHSFSLGTGSVSWRSTRSSSVLSSSYEVEIYAGAMAAQELCWLTYLLSDLGERPRSPPDLYVDNTAMIALCQDQRLEHKTMNIALRYFLTRELQQRGQLHLAYVATQASTADVFTKALGSSDHQRLCSALGLVPTLPHLLVS
ncbi:unnamed protein product [Closterium sp. NIES-54]